METKSESKYERLRKIGIGSYGVVFKCVNRQTRQIVAIKRYSENDSDPIIRKIAMREVRMLRQLKHPNLINLIEVFRRKRRLHLVFDYCELTVLDVIEKYANNCPLNLIKKIIWQTVNGINYCHTHNCIHRDIKPENILINQAGVVKLCDFGFARSISSMRDGSRLQMASTNKRNGDLVQKSQTMMPLDNSSLNANDNNNKENLADRQALTEYVATRWYRAPELLIGDTHYGIKIDIWAIGCVTAELMRGEPLWPGKTDYDQLSMILSSQGQLTNGQKFTLLKQNIYDQPSIDRLLNQAPNLAASIERKLPGARIGSGGVDFVLACVQMDPAKRPTSEELLQHEYIHSVRMAQFVRGASHAIGISSATSGGNWSRQGEQLSLSNGLHQQQTTRSNSQSLMLAAGGNNFGGLTSSVRHNSESPSLSGQQPTKRLIVAAKTSGHSQVIGRSTGARISSIPVAALSTPSASSGNSNSLNDALQYSSSRNDASSRYKRKQPAVSKSTTINVVSGPRSFNRRPTSSSSPDLPKRATGSIKSSQTSEKLVGSPRKLKQLNKSNDTTTTKRDAISIKTTTASVGQKRRGNETKSTKRQLTTTIEGNQTDEFNESELGVTRIRQSQLDESSTRRTAREAADSSASSSLHSTSGRLNSHKSSSMSYLPSIGDSHRRMATRTSGSKRANASPSKQ